MTGRLRGAALLVLLAVAAWLALFGDKTPPGAVAQPGRPGPGPTPVVNAAATAAPVQRSRAAPEAIEALQSRSALSAEAAAPMADLFRSARWQAPQAAATPRAAVPAAPPAGEPPALPQQPYRLIGKKLEADAWEVFLGRGEMSFIARVGDTVEGAWRVDRIEPPTLTFTHLASGQQQTLDIGAAP